MMKLGDYNRLKVSRKVDFGYYLTDEESEVLLPNKLADKQFETGDNVEVFIYNDSEGRLTATCQKPYGKAGDMVGLKVVDVSDFGTFVDWGLDKDLLVPYGEQEEKMKVNQKYVVKICIDYKSNRIIGVNKLNAFLKKDPSGLKEGTQVDLLIYKYTDMGIQAIINQQYLGLLYYNEVFEDLSVGDQRKGYIYKIREDNKIDIRLQPSGLEAIDESKKIVLSRLKESGGKMPYHDKSDPEVIKKQFNMSKKNFKKAIGGLYKEGIIDITPEGIFLK